MHIAVFRENQMKGSFESERQQLKVKLNDAEKVIKMNEEELEFALSEVGFQR